mgnify:CR=1 FL=1|jgi:hypothetical protein
MFMNELAPDEAISSMCILCQELPLARAGVEPHHNLKLQGCLPQPNGAPQECLYQCVTCGTSWLRRTDRWGADAGFRLAP